MKYYKLPYVELKYYRSNCSDKVGELWNTILKSLPHKIQKLIKEEEKREQEPIIKLDYVLDLDTPQPTDKILCRFIIKLNEYISTRKEIQKYLDQHIVIFYWESNYHL